MKKNTFTKIPAFLVATLILINGVINIALATMPLSFDKAHAILVASQLTHYMGYQQVNSIIMIIVGLILVSLAIGLYRRERKAWAWTLAILLFFVIENVYPHLNMMPCSLGIASLIVLTSLQKQFNVRHRTAQTRIIIAWLSVLFAMGYGTIGTYLMRTQFHGVHSVLDAVYYTLVTYSTVGYGDIIPITNDAKLFILTMIIIGLGSFATVITVLLGPLLERRLKKVFSMIEHLNHLRNHAILCGVNQLSIQIAKDLKATGVGILFVDTDANCLADMGRLNFDVLQGDPSDVHVLQQAGLKYAHFFVCATETDAQNILLSLVAHNQRPPKKERPARIITILDKPENAELARKSGSDELVIPALLGSQSILRSLKQEGHL